MNENCLAALLLDEYRLRPGASTLAAVENGRKQALARFLALKLEADPEVAKFFEESVEPGRPT